MRAFQCAVAPARPWFFRMPIDVHAHYVPPQLIDAIDARGKDIGVRSGALRRRIAGAAFRLRVQGSPILSAPDRAGRAAARLARPAGHRPADRRHLARHIRLRPRARRVRRLASDAERHPGGMVRRQRRPVCLDRFGPVDASGSRRPGARARRRDRRMRRDHLVQHREHQSRRASARPVLAKGGSARHAGPDPSGAGRSRRRAPRNSASRRLCSTPSTPRSASARC